MNDTEAQAYELVRQREWYGAAELFDQLLVPAFLKGTPKERLVSYLLGRSECLLELGRHEAVVSDCRRVIKLLADANASNNESRAWKRLVHALYYLQRFAEAEAATQEWLAVGGGAANLPDAVKMLERLRVAYQASNGQNKHINHCNPVLEDDILALDTRLESWTGISPQRQRKHPVELLSEPTVEPDSKQVTARRKLMMEPTSSSHQLSEAFLTQKDSTQTQTEASRELVCTYCCLKFNDRSDLRSHCQSEGHQTMIMSDEGRDWQWRPPPRGLRSDAYILCDAWTENGSCRYGNQCVDAHGAQELAEWRERFEYRRMKLQRASEKELYGKSYTEQLLERWVTAASPERVLRENVDGVEDSCSAELVTTVANKRSTNEWTFTLRSDRPLRTVALLQDATRNHFYLRRVTSKHVASGTLCEWEPDNDQEWSVPALGGAAEGAAAGGFEHTVKVFFTTDIYGTFRQSVVFDLGADPILVRHLCVDVVPLDHVDKMKEIVKELTLCALERWDHRNAHISRYVAPFVPGGIQTVGVAAETERHTGLLNAYPSPRADTFAITQSTIQEKRLTRNNYRARMHELLAVEEMARYEQVARYNMTASLRLATCYLLAPNGMATSTAKYAQNGELFALMTLGKDVSEDTCEGRLILNNCTTVLLAAAKQGAGRGDKKRTPNKKAEAAAAGTEVDAETGKRIVHEALIEDKGKNMIYLRLSAATVKLYKMKTDTDFSAEIQFQLNRIPYCEWHYAIDKIADFRVIFPDTYLEPSIPWTPKRQWNETLDSRLNLKQKEAVVAITTPMGIPLPPILIIGPFGTGKTYTLAQAIKQLLLQSDTKVLVCTHSNSAADLYIKDYLHPYVESGHEEARPLRIYYHKRWVATVNQTVQKYCLIEMAGGARTFRIPTLEDIRKHRIVVVTLSISMYLATLGLNKGHFSHILLDEAAQAMECEAIMPLALATEDTRIVLAGDHMQLSPELFSQFAKERNLHVSLLERLYDHYPQTFPCKVLLCENYRAHEAIIQFTSELFYDQKLISSGKQPRHDKFYPLTFFTTRGEDVQDINSTAFYNNSEVYEVVERVSELRKRWPAAWGKMDDQSIGIMTPYADQVFRIRSELRKRRMGGISVERVLNVQGKQFRAIFLSTVRTRRTCSAASGGGGEMDYGFLSNSKLLNTAITRAQSLVAVVGDPVALCSIGRCRKVWERFIEICNTNKSLFGITWSSLRSQLDVVELKKTYTLNPLAPEFVPRAAYQEPYIRLPSILGPVPPQMPPFNPQIPPYMYRYPLYYYPPQYPIRPPNAPPLLFPATPPPPLNPWGVNYPMASPPGVQPRGANNNVGGFKKKAGEAGRRPENPLDMGLWGGGPTQSPVSMPEEDSYVPGGVFNPANACRGPGFIGPLVREQNDREQIQFLHNVHFPEGRPDMPDFSGLGPMLPTLRPDLQEMTRMRMDLSTIRPDLPRFRPEMPGVRPDVSTLRPDPAGILPNNMGLQEMIDSPPKQLEWYTQLLETRGPLAANKFMELLMLGSRKGPSPSPPHPDMRVLKDVFADKNNLIQPVHMQTQMNPLDLCSDILGNKPFHLCDIEATLIQAQLVPSDLVSTQAPPKQQQDNMQAHYRAQNMMQAQMNMGDAPQMQLGGALTLFQPGGRSTGQEDHHHHHHHHHNMGGGWDLLQGRPSPQETWATPPQPNVPLYRRQPGDGKPPATSSGNSGAFAGYARAAVSNGLPTGADAHQHAEGPYFAGQMSLLQVTNNKQQQQQQQPPPSQTNLNQHLMTQHVNAEFSSDVDGHTTYASVLRAQPAKSDTPDSNEEKGDPFAVLRALGARRDTPSTAGLYQYFF